VPAVVAPWVAGSPVVVSSFGGQAPSNGEAASQVRAGLFMVAR
jgi:hypothetical protein